MQSASVNKGRGRVAATVAMAFDAALIAASFGVMYAAVPFAGNATAEPPSPCDGEAERRNAQFTSTFTSTLWGAQTMVELLIVKPEGTQQDVTGKGMEARFAAVKARTVGYVQVDVLTQILPGACTAVIAPAGAVRNRDEADRFIKALEVEFPGQRFTAAARRYKDATGIFCHPPKPTHLNAAQAPRSPRLND